jgi:hypothetical protein
MPTPQDIKPKPKAVFDGATLSPKLKPKADGAAVSLPIGKTAATGGVEVARAYKHAAGKSSTYSPQVVDMIYHMARGGTFDDEHTRVFVASKLAAERDLLQPAPPLTWDQIVFLSANLTRLVIDPYRERCNSRVVVGTESARPLTLDWPILFGGVDLCRLPRTAVCCMARAAKEAGIAMCAPADFDQTLIEGAACVAAVDVASKPATLDGAAAIELTAPRASQLAEPETSQFIGAVRRKAPGIPVGIAAPACNARRVVDATIDSEPDFYIADAQWTLDARPTKVFAELLGAPAIGVLADVVEGLRHHKKEQPVQVIYRGGIRGGADAGKAVALGATAVTLGLSAVVGMGAGITRLSDEQTLLEELQSAELDPRESQRLVRNFAASVNIEVTILARACGKSSVSNMEPEDMRALTIATSQATGLPMVGKDHNFRTP